MKGSEYMKTKKVGKAEVKQPECKYPRDEIIQNAHTIFKVMPEVVAGALARNSKKEFTVSEVRQAIEAFLKRGVK